MAVPQRGSALTIAVSVGVLPLTAVRLMRCGHPQPSVICAADADDHMLRRSTWR